MSWLGKFFGGAFGFLLGGPLGAILGASIGHQIDEGMSGFEGIDRGTFEHGEQHRVQMAFFTATFAVMGHIAKADGTVSQAEINLAKRVMEEMALSPEMRDTAIKLFQQGKKEDFSLDDVLIQFRHECHRRGHLIRMFLEIQVQAALADGVLDREEEQILLHCCQMLGVSRFEFERLKIQIQAQQRFYGHGRQQQARVKTSSLQDAYAILGIDASASDAEVKKAYRRLMNQNHPDKLVAKGLPEEMMTLAKEKTQKISKAYDLIQKSRK